MCGSLEFVCVELWSLHQLSFLWHHLHSFYFKWLSCFLCFRFFFNFLTISFMCMRYLDHINPNFPSLFSPDFPILPLPQPSFPTKIFFGGNHWVWLILSAFTRNECLPGTIPTKENDSPFLKSHVLSIDHRHLEGKYYELLPNSCWNTESKTWNNLILCHSCACNHSCYAFMGPTATRCIQMTTFHNISPYLLVLTFSPTLIHNVLYTLWDKVNWCSLCDCALTITYPWHFEWL